MMPKNDNDVLQRPHEIKNMLFFVIYNFLYFSFHSIFLSNCYLENHVFNQ